MDMKKQEAFAAFAARHNADRHLELHKKTKQGALVWKAYSEFRKAGVPVPEDVLVQLDRIGAGLLAAKDQREVMRALGMVNRTGGPQRRALLQGVERQRDMVEHYRNLREANAARPVDKRRKVGELAKETAQRFGVSAQQVRTRYSEWKKATR